jgi:putative ABC transport system permease protein
VNTASPNRLNTGGLTIVGVSTLAASEGSQRRSIVRAITAAGGALALFLSSIGLHAVVSFAVGQRVREIGIRTALGAGRQQIVRLFLLREELQPSTVWLAVLIACLVTSVALAASWIPARRAAYVDPLDALRSE